MILLKKEKDDGVSIRPLLNIKDPSSLSPMPELGSSLKELLSSSGSSSSTLTSWEGVELPEVTVAAKPPTLETRYTGCGESPLMYPSFFLSLGGVEESVVGEEFVVSGVGGLVWAI